MRAPRHYERQFMEHLRGAGWVKAAALPDSRKTIENLISKGWIERREADDGAAYRLTALGLEAKKAPLRIR
jgi:hypothetical protein